MMEFIGTVRLEVLCHLVVNIYDFSTASLAFSLEYGPLPIIHLSM